MHHALQIDEILREIIKIVASDEASARNSLVAIAATCKALQPFVLPILWETLPTLAHLLRCLPVDIWEEREVKDIIQRTLTTRFFLRCVPDQTTDWSRYDFYAPFVKSFRSIHPTNRSVNVDTFRTLLSSRPHVPILPNLVRLHWEGTSSEFDTCITHFIRPQLIELTIRSAKVPDGMIQALSSIPRGSLINLKFFCFEYAQRQRSGLTLVDPVSDLILGLRNLERLSSQCFLRADAILHLAASHCTELALPCFTDNVLTTVISSTSHPPFPRLKFLTLSVEDPTHTDRLLTFVQARNLERLSIHFLLRLEDVELVPEEMVEPFLEPFIQQLHTRVSRERLHHLAIRTFDPRRVDYSWDELSRAFIIAPLFEFRNMTSVDLHIPVIIGNAEIERMAAAWPYLEHFAFRTGACQTNYPATSLDLRAVVSFAVHCPALLTLELLIRIQTVDFGDLPNSVLDPPRSLTSLSVAYSVIDRDVEPSEIAGFLSSLFPNLKDIKGYCVKPPTRSTFMQWSFRDNVWQEVTGFLKANVA